MRRALAFAVLMSGCAPSIQLEGAAGRVLRSLSDVSFARTAEARRAGLTGRGALGEEQALVLEFPLTGEVCITNAPVGFAITALFVGPDERVVAAERFEAAEAPARCHDGVARVVELDEAGAPGVAWARLR